MGMVGEGGGGRGLKDLVIVAKGYLRKQCKSTRKIKIASEKWYNTSESVPFVHLYFPCITHGFHMTWKTEKSGKSRVMEKTTFPGPWNLEEFQEKSSFEDFVYDMNYASKVFKKLNKSVMA